MRGSVLCIFPFPRLTATTACAILTWDAQDARISDMTMSLEMSANMIKLINMTTDPCDLERFAGADDLRAFVRGHGMDGLEIMPIGGDSLGWIPRDMAMGIHLSYVNSWYDAYMGDERAVCAEYGSPAEAERIMGGAARDMAGRLRAQLDFCKSVGARYVVYHMGNITLRETLSCRFEHDHARVIDAALDIVNAAMQGGDYDFWFLMENLWGPGFTFTRPDITSAMLGGVDYPRKGIMLDVGHLMHADMHIDTAAQGIAWVHRWLDAHGELCRSIRGVHLHCGASGAFLRELSASPPQPQGTYFERLCAVYESVLRLDPHVPLLDAGARELIERIAPEFLTYEFITRDRAQHSEYIRAQNAALGYAL